MFPQTPDMLKRPEGDVSPEIEVEAISQIGDLLTTENLVCYLVNCFRGGNFIP
jgi:hypothetical protein